MSKLPGSSEDKWEVDFEFARRGGIDNNMGLFSPGIGVFSPRAARGALSRRTSFAGAMRLSLDGECLLKDFLPPASPATISLLEKSGWAVIPNAISSTEERSL
jgi:hypothetical protein